MKTIGEVLNVVRWPPVDVGCGSEKVVAESCCCCLPCLFEYISRWSFSDLSPLPLKKIDRYTKPTLSPNVLAHWIPRREGPPLAEYYWLIREKNTLKIKKNKHKKLWSYRSYWVTVQTVTNARSTTNPIVLMWIKYVHSVCVGSAKRRFLLIWIIPNIYLFPGSLVYLDVHFIRILMFSSGV